MTDLKFDFKKLVYLFLFILTIIGIYINFHTPFFGNGNEKLLWSRFFANGQYKLYDLIYGIEIQPIYHTTLYIHLISFLEIIFGFNIYIIKIFIISIKVFTLFLIRKIYFKDDTEKFYLCGLLWLSIPIVFFTDTYFEVDGHLSYLIVLLYFHSLILKENNLKFYYQTSLLIISFFLKETTFIILFISSLINLIFFKQFLKITFQIFLVSTISIILLLIDYENLTKLSFDLFLKWKLHRFDFLLPGIIGEQNPNDPGIFIFSQINSFFIALKGIFKFGYLNVYVFIFYFLYKLRYKIINDRVANFGFTLFIVSLIIVFASGSYTPRYQVGFILPIIILIFKNLNLDKSKINYKILFINIIFISIILSLFFGNYITNTVNIFENFFIKFFILMLPTFIFLLTILINRYQKNNQTITIIIYLIVINILLNLNQIKDDKSDYLNNPDTIINFNQIDYLNKKYENYDIIVNTIDISPYFKNFDKTFYLRGYASILPGVDIDLLQISEEKKNDYNKKNKDICAGVYRCDYDQNKLETFLKKKDKVLYIENEIINFNKNDNFTNKYNFTFVEKIGTFNIYEYENQ